MKQLDLSGFAQDLSPLPQTDLSDDPTTAIVDGTLAQSFNNDFIAGQQRLLYTDPDAFYRKEGADAVAAAPAVLDQLQELRDRLLDTTVNARQRRNLAQSLDSHLIVTQDNVARHAARQSLVWQNATAQNRLDLLHKQAGFDYGDPQSIANYADAARSAALDQARVAGLRTDSDQAATMVSNAASSIWRSAIEGALATDDTKPAIALHELAGDGIAPADAAILDRYIDGAREREIGRNYLAGIPVPADDPSAPLDLNRSLANLDAAHATATAQNEADWTDNPSQRATNQHFIDVAFGRKKSEVVQAKADIDQALANWLNEPTPDGQPQTELPPPSIWSRLGDEAQKIVHAILAANANGPSRADSSNTSTTTEGPTARETAAIPLALPEPLGLPTQAELADAARRLAGAGLRVAGKLGVRAAGPIAAVGAGLLLPSNSEANSFSLGDGLRAQSFDTDSVTIERRVGGGLFGTGVGARWEDLHVPARFGRPVNGHQILFIDPDALERAIGKEAAQRVLATPGVAPASQTPPQAPPPPIPWVVEMRVATTRNKGKTIVHRDMTEEKVRDYCPRYPEFQRMATEAASDARAAGLPNGPAYGRFVHRGVKSEVDKMAKLKGALERRGIRELTSEQALFRGKQPGEIGYIQKNSSRLDIYEVHRNGKSVCVYEIKTGNARFPDKVMKRYLEEGALRATAFGNGYTHVYVVPIRVK